MNPRALALGDRTPAPRRKGGFMRIAAILVVAGVAYWALSGDDDGEDAEPGRGEGGEDGAPSTAKVEETTKNDEKDGKSERAIARTTR